MRLAVLGNPSSARGRGGNAAERVRHLLRARGHEIVTIPGATGAEIRLGTRRVLESAPGVDAVIAVGGDGTIHHALGGLALTGVPLGMVAAGTGNDIARHVGLPLHDVDASVAIILGALAGRGEVRELDAIRASRPDGAPVDPQHEWSLAVVSAGLDAAVNATANGLRWPTGEGRYLRAIAQELRDLAPYGYRASTDRGRWEGDALLLAAANTRCIGGGLEIDPEADAADGLLEVVRLDPVGLPRLVRLLAHLRTGSHLGQPEVHLERTGSLVIEALAPDPAPLAGSRRGSARRPAPRPMADGEPIAALPLRLEAVPRAVSVLVGPALRSRAQRRAGARRGSLPPGKAAPST